MAELKRNYPDDVHIAKELLQWAKDNGMRIWWGKGNHQGSFIPMLDLDNGSYWTFGVWTNGKIELQFQRMKSCSQFKDPEMRLAFLRKLTAIEGIHIPENAVGRRPSFPLSTLRNKEDLDAFIDIITWAIEVYNEQIN